MNATVIITLLFALLIRWLVALHPYSGYQRPPMYGDYEAQRHWQEITINLPISEWYRNSTENDLLYWGLDYPPLTAYHSYLLGRIAKQINSKWIDLGESRGYESYDHKLFMRSTVLIADLIFLSALIYYWIYLQKNSNNCVYLLRSLFIPSLILIDHGHFQIHRFRYNCVTLGLFFWALNFLKREHDILASIMFCLALNYKQISLYYSLPLFLFLLKKCIEKKSFAMKILKFIALALAVISSFSIIWLPFLTDLDSVLQVIKRIFPINRGIYEDKVANFWFCVSIFFKIKIFLDSNQLAIMSVLCTLLASLPGCYLLLRQSTFNQFKFALINVSLAFFLFSFQVHEKTILFVNTPMILLIDTHPFMVFWFSLIAHFSLLPLLIKDQLILPYFILPIIYAIFNQNLISKSTTQHNGNLLKWSYKLIIMINNPLIMKSSEFKRDSIAETIILNGFFLINNAAIDGSEAKFARPFKENNATASSSEAIFDKKIS
ncbi:hypothetical protein NH340_JMT04415 [Sarcoptes scabiei]|nr:hypothetical protein NH340_JMT04415 [Sarcoptes scabiei]